MMDENLKIKNLDKIINSQTFQGSRINKALLKYLYESTQKGETPKEITIATDILGKEPDFDPTNDTYVRSRMYKLRNKLKLYYETEGKDDPVKLVIPKGSYHIDFIQQKQPEKWKPKNVTRIALVGALCLSIGLNLFLMFKNQPGNHRQQVEKFQPWTDFFNNNLPVLLVEGDFLTFAEFDSNQKRWRSVRDHYINSTRDYQQYKRDNPQRHNFLEKNYHSLGYTSVENALILSKLFQASKKRIITKRASKIQWDDLRNNNIIFEGHQVSLFILRHLLETLDIKLSFREPYDMFLISETGDTLKTFHPTELDAESNNFREGYVLLAKLKGSNNNSMLLCVGNFEMSRSYAVHLLSKPSFLSELNTLFKSHFESPPQHFELVLKVKGFPRTGLSHEIVYLNKVKPITTKKHRKSLSYNLQD